MADVVGGLGGTAGFGETVLPREDDAAFRFDIGAVFEQGLRIAGQVLDPADFFIGTNGVLSFGQGIIGAPPDLALAGAGVPVIAPFWADVDVRLDGEGTESGAIHLDIDPAADTVTVTWDHVGRFRRDADTPNTFQVQLIDRGAGDFDIVFRYQQIGWTSGDLSGGAPALIGLSIGALVAELPASGDAAAQLALPGTAGSGAAGLWQIEVRDGVLLPAPWLRQSQSGTAGADVLTGAGGGLVAGLDGNDTLAGAGGDTLDGGAGTDRASFGFDLAEGVFFSDGTALKVLRAGTTEAVTLLSVEELAFADQIVLASAVPLSGGAGNDLITGGAGADALFGGAGDDTLAGGGGADILDGGAGEDIAVFASVLAGADLIWDGGALLVTRDGETARLTGIEWLDFAGVRISTGPQSLTGTAGADLLAGGAGFDALDGQGGDDTLRGGAGDDTLIGGAGADWLLGEGGDDVLAGGAGGNLLDGGPGQDRARIEADFAGVLVQALPNGDLAVLVPGSPDQTILRGIEIIDFADRSLAAPVALALSGGVIGQGGAGEDVLDGGGGADWLAGGGGNDLLRGGGGNDALEGGDGADTLNGGDGDDSILGGLSEADLRDVIFAGAGNDFVDGGHGNDEINGMDGNDTLLGGFGADNLVGNGGDDTINGGPLSDVIFGNAGADFVNGGFGSDRVNGGAGADRFFHLGIPDHGSDWIQDFTAADWDVLIFGQAGARADQFQVNAATTEGAGAADVAEAFVIYRPTGQIIWALIDGMGNSAINLQIAGSGAVVDLLA